MDWRGIKTTPDPWNLQPSPRNVRKNKLCRQLIPTEREKLSRVENSSLKRCLQIPGNAWGPCTPTFPSPYPSAPQNPLDINSINWVGNTWCQGHPELWGSRVNPWGVEKEGIVEEWGDHHPSNTNFMSWPGSSGRDRRIKHPLNLGIVPSRSIPFMTSDKRGSFITVVLEVNCLFWSDLSLSRLSYCQSHQISKGGIRNNSHPDPVNARKYQLSPRSHDEINVGRGRCHKTLFAQRQGGDKWSSCPLEPEWLFLRI